MTSFRANFRALPLDEKIWCVACFTCMAVVTLGVVAIYVFGWRP